MLATVASREWQMLKAVGLQGSGSGYLGEFSSYAFPTKQSDLVLRIGHGDIVHQGLVQSDTGDEGWAIYTDGSFRYRGRVVIPQSTNLKEEILRGFHCSRFFVHLGGTKMYHDLRRQYYWSRMKKLKVS